MAEIGKDLHKAKKILDQGKLIGLPTETVYGLAGNGLDPAAVAKIFTTKNRPTFDPLILHISNQDKLLKYVKAVPEPLNKLMSAFWPGSLTVLLERKAIIPDLTCSALPRVAFRIPDHNDSLNLLQMLDYPLAAPSANPFGYISPTTAEHVERQLGDKIEYILDGDACRIGLESTIVGMEKEQVTVYRLGGIPLDAIEKEVGQVKVMPSSSSNPKAPGMIKSHYAPSKSIILGSISEQLEKNVNSRVGVLSFQKHYKQAEICLRLSPDGNLAEAATNLFAYLRELDESDVDLIISEFVPEHGLGKAINDRLRRASVKSDK